MIQALKIANFETICIVNVWPLSGGIPVIMKETPYPNWHCLSIIWEQGADQTSQSNHLPAQP